MVGAGVHNAQSVSRLGKVKVHLTVDGIVLIGKVDGHDAPQGAGHLIHQAGGLAEVDILGVLAHHGDLGQGQLIPAEEVVHHHAHQHLIAGGGGQAGAAGHV